jgi:hypothetical protein
MLLRGEGTLVLGQLELGLGVTKRADELVVCSGFAPDPTPTGTDPQPASSKTAAN